MRARPSSSRSKGARDQEIAIASLLSHPAAALALGAAFKREGDGAKVWALGALCTMVPDLDVAAFAFGIPYAAPFGHRGFTHSICFAALLALALARWAFEKDRLRIGLFLFLCAASHGLLDAMTDGGKGVGFFLPFLDRRYFLPWRPIRVSPIGAGFFSARGLEVIKSELLWVWAPCLAFAGAWSGIRWAWPRTSNASPL